ncbi:MAG: glycerate kinase [Termitinemataceae bacterium]|nr:MAG: glycerate kinase [Termitinemataceae bacterium]
MKNFIIIPDSFKGTMSSLEICNIMAESVKRFFCDANILCIPVADGGEGTVDAFLSAVGGTKIDINVCGPFNDVVPSFYGILSGAAKDGEKTAVIEMAACAGLPLAEGRLNPECSTTFGVGELIKSALDKGCSKIITGLGGSATNDGACGAASALGVRFFDKSGNTFVPTGGSLKDICRIDTSGIDPRLKDAQLISMCDIDNPLCGKTGAAYIFGPQKGASHPMVKRLDSGLKHLAEIVQHDMLLEDAAEIPGAGAAGGMGFGMKIFFGSKLQMGIETVLDTVQFDKLLKNADIVFSGEGKIDTQSLRGKVVIGIARRTKKAGVPLFAVVGDIGDNIESAYTEGVSAIFSINRVAIPFIEARRRAKTDLALTMDTIMRVINIR